MSKLIETLIRPRERDLGGFSVRRVLPYRGGTMVGPFIFFDHMGPARFPVGTGIDVRPHPHIGLATVTYLFEGEIVHRDSLGFVQPIRPGDVNWMTAGRGIVHSERSAPEEKARGPRLHGIQTWLALPKKDEEMAPAFVHYPGAGLPVVEEAGVRLTVIAGEIAGACSPVATRSPTFYGEARMEKGATLALPGVLGARAVYVVEGTADIGGEAVRPAEMAVLAMGPGAIVRAETDARVMVLGGEPLDGKRHIWWNLVSSDPVRIEQAKADWREGRFASVPGDDEFIPLPEE